MIRLDSTKDCATIAQKYWNKQVLQFTGTKEDSTRLCQLIFDKLVYLGVPQDDLNNYTILANVFVGWISGTNYSEYSDDKIEFEEIRSDKGFYLIGTPGTGKTTFLDACCLALNEFTKENRSLTFYSHFSNKNTNKVRFIPLKVRANSITRAFRIGGDIGRLENNKIIGGIDRYSKIGVNENDKFRDYEADIETPNEDRYPVLYIDDFRWGGTTANSSSFGNQVDVLTEVIKNRYDRDLMTFITSNSAPSEIDDATKDRMKAMFNVILFKGDSNRK